MRVRFRCGHVQDVNPDRLQGKPKCFRCGETVVARVLNVRLPTITGHGSGPLVESKDLPAIPVSLAPDGALKLKPRKDEDE